MTEQIVTQPQLVEATFFEYDNKEQKTYIGFLDKNGSFHYVVQAEIGGSLSGGMARSVSAKYVDKVTPLITIKEIVE